MSDHLAGFGGSVIAADLAFETMPDWLRAATLHRFAGVRDAQQLSWHTYARAAVDECGLPWQHRGVLRVLIDWHNGRTRTVEPRQSEIARRIPAERARVNDALEDLIAWGWLHAVSRPGRPSVLTLLCPVDEPAFRVGTGVRGVPSEHTQPVPSEHTPVLSEHTPCAQSAHHRGTGVQGYISGVHVTSSRDGSGARSDSSVDIATHLDRAVGDDR
ncbi:MAG TPA: hypothetical protein VIX41_08915 [Acidimicrobiales bacterium]